MKGYNKKISDIYVLPLPFLVSELPPLIPHNPVSVVMYLWALVFRKAPVQTVHTGSLIASAPGQASGVRVTDPTSAMKLWQEGFFGKGTLSRSEPSWFGRTARRLGLDGGEITLEELTEMRRQKRREFKSQRELAQKRELVDRIQAEHREAPRDLVEAIEKLEAVEKLANEKEDAGPLRDEDRRLIHGDTIERVEYLHLSPAEAVFLKLGLGVLDVYPQGNNNNNNTQPLEVPELLRSLLNTPQLWRKYVVYHYLRSAEWCVRSGVKFGVHWLLYRKGPPFQHAEFAIMVLDTQSQPSWSWVHSNMRVVGGAKKTLLLIYVDGPASMPDWDKVTSVADFRRVLGEYTVKPVTFTRFAPSRNRD